MDEINIYILEQMFIHRKMTSKDLALQLGCSDRTVRNRIHAINKGLDSSIARIESRRGIGLELIIHDSVRLKKYIEFIKKENRALPKTKQGRINFIIDYLLINDDYINLNSLSQMLFVSRATLAADMVEVKKVFKKYDIEILDCKQKGIRIQSSEKNIRKCFSDINREKLRFNLIGNDYVYDKIQIILRNTLEQNGFALSDLGYYNLCNHLYIMIERLKSGNYQDIGDFAYNNIEFSKKTKKVACELSRELGCKFNITLSNSEFLYIMVHLEGKKNVSMSKNKDQIWDDTNIYNIVCQFLDSIYIHWNIDLRQDHDLIFYLMLHFKPMSVRLKSGFQQKNPMLEEIRSNFPFSYLLTIQSSYTIEQAYRTEIIEDELGFIALHINIALSKWLKNNHKKNVLILCPNGLASSQILANEIKQNFSGYVNQVSVGQTTFISMKNLEAIDLIITTAPIDISTDIPVVEVNYFLSENDKQELQQYIIPQKNKPLLSFFDSRLFLKLSNVKNKEEIIRVMIRQIGKYYDIPDDFFDLIIERERLGSTDYGNLVAIPHPNITVTEKTIVCIGVLDKPILWGDSYVQVIFLVSIQKEYNANLHYFYKIISKYLSNKCYIDELIERPSYEFFTTQIEEIEKERRI